MNPIPIRVASLLSMASLLLQTIYKFYRQHKIKTSLTKISLKNKLIKIY
jgi:hypothetical protein